jgi:hypothetical protein
MIMDYSILRSADQYVSSRPMLIRSHRTAFHQYRISSATMKRALLLLAIGAVTLSVHAEVPADLRQLAGQIETFPLTIEKETESKRLAKFFEMYWAAGMREAPNFATYIGYPGLG